MGESTVAMKLLIFVAFVVAMAVAEQNSMPLFTWKSGEAPTDSPTSVNSALTSALSGSPEIVMVYMLHETSAQQMMDAKDTLTHLKVLHVESILILLYSRRCASCAIVHRVPLCIVCVPAGCCY